MSGCDFGDEVSYVELHPTNSCIFSCPWCTYRPSQKVERYRPCQGHERETLGIDLVDRVLDLNPKRLLLCGGGDPTSYSTRQGDTRFQLSELAKHVEANGIGSAGIETLLAWEAEVPETVPMVVANIVKLARRSLRHAESVRTRADVANK